MFASRLHHPHLGETLDHGTTGADRPFLVMAFHAGTALAQRQGPLPEADVARLGVQLARGLAALHAEGLVHRDVTPANVLVEPSGHARLIDFGMLAPAPAQSRGEGTPLFMAPEALRSEVVDARAGDILWKGPRSCVARPTAHRDGDLAQIWSGRLGHAEDSAHADEHIRATCAEPCGAIRLREEPNLER
jgi:serine/threonine protein kinase